MVPKGHQVSGTLRALVISSATAGGREPGKGHTDEEASYAGAEGHLDEVEGIP